MEAIRETQVIKDGQLHLQLPKQFWRKEVEIIMFSASQEAGIPAIQKKSLRGCLKQYAQPDLMTQEQEAWQTAVSEKDGYR